MRHGSGVRLGIRIKLAIILLAVMAVSVAATIGLSLRVLEPIAEQEAADNIRRGADAIRVILEERQRNARLVAEALASNAALISSLRRANEGAARSFARRALQERGLDYVVVTDVRGRVLARGHETGRVGDDVADRPAFSRPLEGVAVATMEQTRTMGLVAAGGAPVFERAPPYRALGTLVVGTSVDQPAVDELARVIGNEIAIDVPGAGTVASSADLVADRTTDAGLDADPEPGAIVLATLGARQYRVISMPIVGLDDRTLAGRVRIARSDASLVATRARVVKRVLIGAAVIGLCAVLLAIALSAHVTGPLARLTRAAESFARGESPEFAPVRTGDEVETLGRTLRHMATSVTRRTDELARARERFEGVYQSVPVGIWEEDITALRDVFTALRAKGIENLGAYFDRQPEALRDAARTIRIVGVNRAILQMFRAESEERLREGFERIVPDDKLSEVRDEIVAIAEGQELYEVETVRLALDGTPFDARIRVAIPSIDEPTQRLIVSIADISERKRLERQSRMQERQLTQSNKMAALGTLVSGMAHEINNPNALVAMNSSVLIDVWRDAIVALDAHARTHPALSLGRLPWDDVRREIPILLDDMRDASRRIEKIVSGLKDFSRPHQDWDESVYPVNDAVRRAVDMLSYLIRSRTRRFSLDLEDPSSHVEGDQLKLEQVIVNLLVNALEALPTLESSVRVATRALTRGPPRVEITIADEGVGIEPEHLERLFEPFFTTKQSSGGTGLGLSISYGIVREHGGEISFESEPGRGTVARVVLGTTSRRKSPDTSRSI